MIRENKKSLIANTILSNTRYFIFVLLIVIFSLVSPKFLDWKNISSLIRTTTSLAIATVGITFVIITGGIDLSLGSIILVSGSAGIYAANAGAGLWLSLLASTCAGLLCGAFNGLLVAKFKLVPFLATLATMSFFKGLILQFGNDGYVILNDMNLLKTITTGTFLGLPSITYGLIIIVIVASILLKKTPFGWHLYAAGNNAEAAEKLGIKVGWLRFSAYAICGALTGITGFINMCMVGSVPTNFGDGQEFTIISAAVLGGVSLLGGQGSVFPGAIVGILIFTIIENGMTISSANPYFYTVLRAIVIFIAILIDSINKKHSELR